MTKQIIAMGGGGFSMEPENPLLDDYVLQQSGKVEPEVCFLPQASAESLDYVNRFFVSMLKQDAKPSWLSLYQPQTNDIEDFLLSKDVIYVGGGNTKNMLALWRAWELDQILAKAYDAGVVLAGISAGAICWFEQGLTDSVPGTLSALPCLGLLPGSCSPHYDGEADRESRFKELIATEQMQAGYGIEDSAAIHFVDGVLGQVVSSVQGKQAYWVEKEGAEIHKTALDVEFLGKD